MPKHPLIEAVHNGSSAREVVKDSLEENFDAYSLNWKLDDLLSVLANANSQTRSSLVKCKAYSNRLVEPEQKAAVAALESVSKGLQDAEKQLVNAIAGLQKMNDRRTKGTY
jgi:hypothetical protein